MYRTLHSPDGADGGSPPTDATEPDEARRADDLGPPARDRDELFLKEIADRERKAAGWERAFKAAVRDREIATALAGRPLVPGAASQLIRLWRDEFDVYEEAGEHKVADRSGRPVARAVEDWLASAEYAHFCRPPGRGGTASPTASRPSPPDHAAPPAPRTLGEAAVLRWRESAARPKPAHPGPVGLGRRR